MYRIGIDLGGTKMESIVLDDAGQELFRNRIETQQQHGYRHILNRIKELHDESAARIGNQPHRFGIGTPGVVSPRTGLMKNSNTTCLIGQPLKSDLENLMHRRVEIQNDANCFAMAEALYGAGKENDLVFGIIMGTGCGGGIVHKGQVIVGRQAIAGEWGHTSMVPDGPACYCGQRGCVETFISGGGAEARYAGRFGVQKPFREIEKDFYAKEPKAVEFMQTFFAHFGRALANVIDIMDPDIVVIGGGVSNFDALYTEGVAQVAKFIFSDSLETPIVKHKLGDSAGVIGAALIGV